MNSSEIDRESGRRFESLLLPNWAVRSQEDQEDYGVDAEIEVTSPEDRATGLIFKVQLKGVESAKYDDQGLLVFPKASVERFNYYVSKLRIPIIFVVCDLDSGDCFWIRVQGNRALEEELASAISKNQKTFTVKLPKGNKFEKNTVAASSVLESVESTVDTIALRRLRSMSSDKFCDYIHMEDDIEGTQRHFRFFAGLAAHKEIEQLILKKEFQEAGKKARALLDSETEQPEIRIRAGLNLSFAFHKYAVSEDIANSHFEAAKQRLSVASVILQIARKLECNSGLKRYVQAFARGARLGLRGHLLEAICLSEGMQRFYKESLSAPILALQRIEQERLVTRDFFRIHELILRALKEGHTTMVPYMVKEVIENIIHVLVAFRTLEKDDLASACLDCLLSWVSGAISMLGIQGIDTDGELLAKELVLKAMHLADWKAADEIDRVQKVLTAALDGVTGFRSLDQIKLDLAHVGDQMRSLPVGDQKLSTEELIPLIEQHAASLGIDLSNPDDRIAEIVRIGIEDLDPTRVARNCCHIHLRHGSSGIPAEMLGLPTAGSKIITCLKHGHSMQGLKLDDLYAMFAQRRPWDKEAVCCDNCPDASPHPEGWVATEQYWKQQSQRFELMRSDHTSAYQREEDE